MYNNKTGLLSPRGTLQATWTPYTHAVLGPTYVMPSIGEALRKYLGNSEKVWQCPTGGSDYNGVDPYASTGANPMDGYTTGDVWLPNYFYMSSKVYAGLTTVSPSVATTRIKPGFNAADWVVRNVAGLRSSKARSVTGQSSSQIVVFVEYKSTFHTRSATDIYNLSTGQLTNYLGNFAFLDGHAETRKYRDRDGYMSQLHDPIEQTWYGKDYATTYPEQFDPANLYKH